MLLLAASPAALAQADDSLQAQIKARLEALRVPIFGDGALLAGATATYSVRTDGCMMRIDIAFPSAASAGRSYAAHVDQVAIDWARTGRVEQSGSYIFVNGPTVPGGRQQIFAGSADGADSLAWRMDALAINCGGAHIIAPAPRPSPLPVAAPAPSPFPIAAPAPSPSAFAERVADADYFGDRACHFRAVPELQLVIARDPEDSTYAHYHVAAREHADAYHAYLELSVHPPLPSIVPNWRGFDNRIDLRLFSQVHGRTQITRAVIAVDGRDIGLPFRISQLPNTFMAETDGPYDKTVTIIPQPGQGEGQLLEAMARGSTMTITLYGAAGEVSRWTFDVHTLRYVPEAIHASNWSCG